MDSAVSDHKSIMNGHRTDRPQEPARTLEFEAQLEGMRRCEMGTLLLAAGCYQEALEQFERALDCQPHDLESWCGRSEALACLNRYTEALSSLEQAQDLAIASDIGMLVQKAVLLIFLSRYQEALACCACILQQQPDHVQALLFQGVAHHRLRQYRQAYRSYHRANSLASTQDTHVVKRLSHGQIPHSSTC